MNFILLSVFMMIVTFIPRVLPGFLLNKINLGPRSKKFLNLIPFTAMASLIFPGVLSVDSNKMWIGALGALFAIMLSLIKKIPSALVVVLSIAFVMLIYTFL